MLCACGTKDISKDYIELTVTEPESVQQGTKEKLTWTELGSLTDTTEMRESWDETLGVTGTTGNKSGGPYVTIDGTDDNNNTLQRVLHNKDYYQYFNGVGDYNTTKELAEATEKSYVDLTDEDQDTKLYMGINGYFDIIQDSDTGYSNPNETITRAEAMSGLMRATTPVSTNVSEDKDFKKAVGDSEYNVYAQELNDTSYISTADGSLNSETYNSTITRGEVIYMLVNTYYSEDLAKVDLDSDTSALYFSDVTNAGDIAKAQGYEGNQAASKTLKYMLENPEDGVDEQMYKALIVAYQKGIIDDDSLARLEDGCTKVEYIGMLVRALANDDSMNKFGEAEDERFLVAEDGSVISTVDDKYYTFEQVEEPSDMFPNGQDDYAVQKWGEYQKYWDDFSVYGTFGPTDAPPGGETGYNEDYLVEKTTDKGAKCIVDTRTGKVYYHNMVLPTGLRYAAGRETNSMAGHYIEAHEDQCPNGVYSFTYEMMQDCYGYPVN